MLLRPLEEMLAGSFDRSPTRPAEVEPLDVPFTPTDVTMPRLPAGYLSAMCEVQDRVPVLSRFSEDTGYVHASALVDMCARAYALARRHNVDIRQSPSPAMRIIWEMGLTLERHVIRQVAAYHGIEHVQTDFELIDEEYRIVGRPDLLVQVSQDTQAVTEIKSMNLRDWQGLSEPLMDHVVQAALYRWLLDRNSHWRAHTHVILIYVAKDFTRGSPYKEFHVDVTQGTAEANVRRALELAAELRDAEARGGVPERRLCSRQNCARARNCGVATLCFNLPAEAT